METKTQREEPKKEKGIYISSNNPLIVKKHD